MPSILNATTTNGLVTSADNSGSLQLQTNNGTTAVTIDTSQNVGIGTSTPAEKLQIVGTGDLKAEIQTNSTNNAAFRWKNASNSYIWQLISGALRLFDETAGAERVRVDSSGNMFVGGTSQNTANNPVYSSTTAKAWLNMATGATFTTRASFNVSSLTRVAAGTLRMNFTNAMTDNNYVTVLGARRTDGGGSANGDPNICVGVAGSGALSYSSAVTTSFVQIVVGVQGASSGSDQGDVFAAVFR